MLEWKKIWELTIWDKKFNGVDKLMQPKVIKYHYYLANELANLERNDGDVRILYTTDKVAYTSSVNVEGNISEGEVVAIPWGGNPTVKYYNGRFVTADNRIATSNDTAVLNNKYLYYFMLSRIDTIGSFYRGAGIKHPSMLSVLNMDIPVPSIAEQSRIVGILDTFSASIENLKQQIALLRKQFEHYRDQLLDLEGKEGVEKKMLGEVCEIKGRIGFRGYTREDQVAPGEGALSLSPGNIVNGKMDYSDSTYISWKKYEESPEIMVYEGDVLFCKTGSTVGKVAVANDIPYKATINPQLVVLKDVKIGSKYLYFYLTTPYIQKVVKVLAGVGSVPNISQAKLSELKILLPSLSEQSRIVSILDTFEASIANLEHQLAQRERQYEYYRNKLLTFE